MFKRRKKRSLLGNLREILWPKMGWRRMGHYIHLRMIRLNATPHHIALGIAFGASISFIPLPGTHIISAALFTKILRGSVLASLIGTLIGTPWTFPLMWWAAYHMGAFAFYAFGLPVAAMPSVFLWHDLVAEIETHPFDLLVPWIMGGVMVTLITWPIFYYMSYRLVVCTRLKHAHARSSRIKRV